MSDTKPLDYAKRTTNNAIKNGTTRILGALIVSRCGQQVNHCFDDALSILMSFALPRELATLCTNCSKCREIANIKVCHLSCALSAFSALLTEWQQRSRKHRYECAYNVALDIGKANFCTHLQHTRTPCLSNVNMHQTHTRKHIYIYMYMMVCLSSLHMAHCSHIRCHYR